MAINDFGEKIGGAKKDLWKERGLIIDDLVYMNEAERKKLITKDNIWKKPNYQELIDNGLSIRIAYFIKMIRDATPVRPTILEWYADFEKKDAQETYIKFVNALKDKVMNLSDENEILNFYNDFLRKYLISTGNSYRLSVLPEAKGCIDNKLLKAAQVRKLSDIDFEIRKKQFCYSPEQKILSEYKIRCYDGETTIFEKDYAQRDVLAIKEKFIKRFIYLKGEFANPQNWKVNSFFIEGKNGIVANNFDTKEDAQNYILSNHVEEEKVNNQKKKRFVPEQLKDLRRNGEDYRNDKNITGEDMLREFQFKGGEFGNWLNELDRQQSLNYCYDALKDLSRALNMETKDIALNNSLSIAFGARGEGSALAHYEKERNVINLTKMKGAGSLAHEWGHALDHALGRKVTGTDEFITEFRGYYRNDKLKVIKELIDTMKYKIISNSETLTMQIQKHENNINALRSTFNILLPTDILNKKQLAAKEKIFNEMVTDAEQGNYRKDYLNENNSLNDSIEQLSKLRKEALDKSLSKDDKDLLTYKQMKICDSKGRIGKPETIETNFYKNSKEFDSIYAKTDKRYWQSDAELFARAFACYVQDKLGYRSDYLCGHAELALGFTVNKDNELELIKAFPEGEERAKINLCFDKVIEFAKEKELLHEQNLHSELKENEEIEMEE